MRACGALAFAVVLVVFGAADAELRFSGVGEGLAEEYPPEPVLLSYGEEARTVTVLHRGDRPVSRVGVVPADGNTEGVWTAEDPAMGAVSEANAGWTNYTVYFSFEEGLGRAKWAFEVEYEDGEKETAPGEFIVCGAVFRHEGRIVSGLGGEGVSLGTYEDVVKDGELVLDVEAIGADGSSDGVDLAAIDVVVRDESGQSFKQADNAAVGADGKLVVKFAPYRVGSGKMIAEVDALDLEVDGEAFETVINISFDTSETPPAVVDPETMAVDADGYASVTAYNLLSPPASEDVRECVLSVGGVEVKHDLDRSKMVQPDQTLVFPVDGATGPASLECDGKSVVILGGDGASAFDVPLSGTATTVPPEAGGGTNGTVAPDSGRDVNGTVAPEAGGDVNGTVAPHANGDTNSTGTGTEDGSGDLAINNLDPPLDARNDKGRLGNEIRVRSGDPSNYTLQEAADVLDAVCFYTSGSECSLVNVTRGSAVLHIQNYVAPGSEDAAAGRLRAAIDSCDMQSERLALPCDEVELNAIRGLEASAVSAGDGGDAPRRGTRRVSVLTAGLTAVAGCLALVAVVVASLWVAYRRSAEQTESQFSADGPTGVPESNEALYQQAIVRDIYGRGDFSGGCPSVEIAEMTRRQADMRDVPLQPPSSTGSRSASFLSGRTGSDAAQSFSV